MLPFLYPPRMRYLWMARGKRLKYHEQDSLFHITEVVPVPETRWRCPHEFPDLSGAKVICFDTEARDPHLLSKGPGYQRGDAQVVGLSVGVDTGEKWYFPMRHELGGNLDPDTVMRWARSELGRADQPKIGANLLYDIEALGSEGVDVRGPLIDVQIAEPLLDEHRFAYGLDVLAKEYLGEGKVAEAMYKWCADAYGGKPTRTAQAGNIWRAPVQLVGPYAESDVDLPIRIYRKQYAKLKAQNLLELFELECSLIPMLANMRKRGIRVDVKLAEQLNEWFKKKEIEGEKRIRDIVGYPISVNAPESFVKFLEKEGLSYPRTNPSKSFPKGQPSITKEWLEACPHPIAGLIGEQRKWEKFRTTFIEGYILNSHINGRVHGQFHQLKNDENGTISGRFSSSNPNLENIPTRDKTTIELEVNGVKKDWLLGELCRMMYLPDEGEDFGSNDYSQIEYRVMTHYGKGPSAERAQKLYQTDPKTDFHNMVVDMTGLSRSTCKNINFGKSYGFGKEKAAAMLGCSIEQAMFFMDQYDRMMPFIKELNEEAKKTAERDGVIITLLGRRARFNLWESKDWDTSRRDGPMQWFAAKERYGERRIRRAQTHKALNALAQGGAADIFKKAMADCQKAGVFAPGALGAPLNLVHDECCVSIPRTKEGQEAHREMTRLMESAVKLKVPLMVGVGVGPTWAEAH